MAKNSILNNADAGLFYKYMGFGPHTRLSLFMLFCHKAIFFSHRSVLNDPTDCTPHLFNDLDEDAARSWIGKIIKRDKSLSDHEIRDAKSFLENRKSKEEDDTYDRESALGGGLLGTFRRSPVDFISNYMKRKVSDARVFSMSKTWDEPRMWAHYASSHSGFCLGLVGVDAVPKEVIFDQVDYTTRRPRISATEICLSATGDNEELRREVYSRSYLQKSVGWRSEQEYRLILPADADVRDRVVLSLPEGTYLRCPEVKVASVIFGLNANRADRDLFEEHFFPFYECDKPSIFKIKQTDKSYDLEAGTWKNKAKHESWIFKNFISWLDAPSMPIDSTLGKSKGYIDWVPDVEVKNPEDTVEYQIKNRAEGEDKA